MTAPQTQKPPDRSFEEFFREQYRPVVGYLLVTGAELAAAQDATQEAMIYAYRRWATIQRNPRRWVRIVARQVWIRGRQRDRERVGREQLAQQVAAGRVDPVNEITTQRWATELIDRLPPMQREVMRRHIFGDLTPAEIARQLGRSPATVRSNLKHARENLRRLSQADESINPTPTRED